MISGPGDLRLLGLPQLRELAEEIRQRILSVCLRNGGHLGASLGAVDLAIALHYCFESPSEPIVWDVGHQAYAHKLLTGRWERFNSLRQTDGISGFLTREESPHDIFGAGHSSTSLSVALALAWTRRQTKQTKAQWTVAVIGDGGLTAGLALEALNNVRATDLGPLLVVVNDNQMSISPNVGAIPAILAGGGAGDFFSHLGFDYLGPVDGHDLPTLIGTLRGIRESANRESYEGRPVLLHVLTQKGKGYGPAEDLPSAFHGVSPVQLPKVPGVVAGAPKRSWSEAFGEALAALAAQDSKLVAISAAMPEGTGLSDFARREPGRFFDVGIAEPHAVTFAAGLATQGYLPVVAIYSTFLQRGLDQLIHDAALQRLRVIVAVDRAGIVGADGPTHHGAFDIAYVGLIPGVKLLAPACLGDLSLALEEARVTDGPTVIRYPRGSGPESFTAPLEDGVRWLHRCAAPPRLIVVALGAPSERAYQAALDAVPGLEEVEVISTVHAKPISAGLIQHLRAHRDARLMVVEDGTVRGGFGQALLAELGPRSRAVELAGYPDRFIPHGAVGDLEAAIGVSRSALAARILRLLAEP